MMHLYDFGGYSDILDLYFKKKYTICFSLICLIVDILLIIAFFPTQQIMTLTRDTPNIRPLKIFGF